MELPNTVMEVDMEEPEKAKAKSRVPKTMKATDVNKKANQCRQLQKLDWGRWRTNLGRQIL